MRSPFAVFATVEGFVISSYPIGIRGTLVESLGQTVGQDGRVRVVPLRRAPIT